MNTRMKTKLALADAIAQAMWIKGLITLEERKRISQHCHEMLGRADC